MEIERVTIGDDETDPVQEDVQHLHRKVQQQQQQHPQQPQKHQTDQVKQRRQR